MLKLKWYTLLKRLMVQVCMLGDPNAIGDHKEEIILNPEWMEEDETFWQLQSCRIRNIQKDPENITD